MTINLISCCKNEDKILPFFLKHYSSFCDSIILYDGHSTDRTLEIASTFPKVKVVQEDSGAEVDEELLLVMKNQKYKQTRNEFDWQIIVDTDEFLYHPDLLQKLEEYKSKGITIVSTEGYDMYSKLFPAEGSQITEIIQMGFQNPLESKSVIFNPKVVDINYHVGCHQCSPSGIVKHSNEKFKVLHYKFISYEYTIAKAAFMDKRRSEQNRKHGYGWTCEKWAKMTQEEFDRIESQVRRII